MGEEGRVEVAAQSSFLAEVDPLLKVLRLKLVSVGPVTVFKDRIGCMQVHLRSARDEFDDFIEVFHELLWISCAARIIAGRLNSTRQWFVWIGVKASDIITLPAMQGYRYIL